jgi:hypothetical protein
MRNRPLVLLLFCAALLAQIGAPFAGAAARAAEHIGLSPEICQILRSSRASLDPSSVPAGTHAHGADCGLCVAGSGDAPVESTQRATISVVLNWRLVSPDEMEPGPVVSDTLNPSAAPRAPPVLG